jgi:hypothetical protein
MRKWFRVTYRGANAKALHLFVTKAEPGVKVLATTACGVDPYAAVEDHAFVRFVPEGDPAMGPVPRCPACEAAA